MIKLTKCLIYTLFTILFFSACSDDNKDIVDPPLTGPQYENATQYRQGITRISKDSLAFKIFAPGKKEIHLVGDFNNWKKEDAYRMKADDTNTFFIKIGNLDDRKEYICQYLIDGKIRIGDPYATKTSDPLDHYISSATYPNMLSYPSQAENEIAMVVSTTANKYNWQVNNFVVEDPTNLTIYELLFRDFTGNGSGNGNVKKALEKLPYLKELGVNAIELLPFSEFEGNNSWGYNPSYYFAPDKAYGTPDDYKKFIDECHKNGIAVIMDMVLNHAYGQCPMARMYVDANWKMPADNPYFNAESPNQAYSWGYDFNHKSPYTEQFTDSVAAYWMSEYKVDGFRYDFTKGFTNTPGDGWAYDASRIQILKRMASEVWKRKSDALVVMEHLADNKEETELANYGIYLWGNMNYNFNEATMGYGEENENKDDKNSPLKGNVTWSSYKARGWAKPTLVAYMESHDEERLMYKNEQYGAAKGTYNVKEIPTGLERVGAAAAIYMTIPGPKMIWQFGELGYDKGIDSNGGRTAPKPTGWYLEGDEDRMKLHNVYAKLIKLKKENTAEFMTTDFVIDVTKNYKQVLLKGANKYVCTIANLGMTTQTATVNFGKAGTWTDQFSDETITTTAPGTMSIALKPGEFRVYFSN